MNFIPAQESAVFIRTFRFYVKWLFKRRFNQVWLHQEYQPTDGKRTVYFLNHTSWWDGLIPFLLNEYRFHQNARAMMQGKQMKKYPFFKWLGTFSMESDDSSHMLRSLRYAVNFLQHNDTSLFIYPEGEIKKTGSDMCFKSGIGWLCLQLPQVDFVPVGIHLHTIRHDKPELHLWVGKKLTINSQKGRTEITELCEDAMHKILRPLLATAGFEDTLYEPFF